MLPPPVALAPPDTAAEKGESMEARTLQSPAEALLIVDDDPLITDLFLQYMTRRGYVVHTAQSGDAALELAKTESESLRLVITDMTMPGMDGLGLAAELARVLPQLPVLIATGHDFTAASLALTPNVVGLVQKPYQSRLLAEQIRQFLDSPDQPFPKQA